MRRLTLGLSVLAAVSYVYANTALADDPSAARAGLSLLYSAALVLGGVYALARQAAWAALCYAGAALVGFLAHLVIGTRDDGDLTTFVAVLVAVAAVLSGLAFLGARPSRPARKPASAASDGRAGRKPSTT